MTIPVLSAEPYIHRWSASGAAERASYQLFLSELCDLLELPRPEPTRPDEAQAKAVLSALRDCESPVTPEELAKQFQRGHKGTIEELLKALATLGQARRVRGKYTG